MAEIVTAHQIREMLAENIDGLSRVDMSTMGLEVFPRLMEMLSQNSNCPDCEKYFEGLIIYARDVRLIFKGSKQEQLRFQKLTSEAVTHLKRVHGIRPRGQLRSLFLFWGSVAGLFLGWLVGTLFFPQSGSFQSALLGWICAVIPAWVLGTIQEARIKKENKLF